MPTEQATDNAYLDEVLAEQAQVENELKRRKAAAAPAAPASVDYDRDHFASRPPTAGRAIDFRITGFWRWKTVIVPPNVYVVHTRRGYRDPITLGLGLSFPFNPASDAFLLIPASLQTLVINGKCITRERQGVLVQAYVQWIIDDLATAYRRLDFSDPDDPMRIVNVQLREQAEAVLKDKVATMTIDQVLTDKLPIIEELTQRLRLLAEGTSTGENMSGLGLRIVTVQIKEAVVSSTRLWENLQKPFRAAREKEARLAELEAQAAVAAREQETRQATAAAELEAERALTERRAAVERERYDRDRAEQARRHRLEQEAERQAVAERQQTELALKAAALERALKDLELEAQHLEVEAEAVRRRMRLDEVRREQERARALAELQLAEERSKARAARAERRLALQKAERAVANDLSDNHLRSRLIERLPEVAQALPKPEELRTVTILGDGGATAPLVGFLAGALSLAEDVLAKRATTGNGKAS